MTANWTEVHKSCTSAIAAFVACPDIDDLVSWHVVCLLVRGLKWNGNESFQVPIGGCWIVVECIQAVDSLNV
jgi:hypothetical protein